MITAAAAILVSACDNMPTLKLVKEGVSAALPSSSAYPRTRAEVDALPYAQLGVRISKGGRGIMGLKEKNDSDEFWISSNRIVLVLHKGRIVRTVGLPVDLLSTRNFGPDFIDGYDFENGRLANLSAVRTIDFGSTYGAYVRSKFTVEGPETISILDQPTETLRVREDLESDSLKWQARNFYWLSRRSALIWRSEQNLAPDLLSIETEVLKRAA